MPVFIVLLLLFLLPTPAHAIVNIEGMGVESATQGVSGKVSLAVNGSSGNSNTLSGEGDGRLDWRHGRNTEIAVASYAYGKSNGTSNTNKSLIHLRHRYALLQGLDIEAFVQAQQDEFARLKLRTLVGGGLRLGWGSEGWKYWLGLGAFFENEILRSTAANPLAPRSQLWRGNAYFTLAYKLNDRVSLQNTVYYQPAWRDTSDYRMLESAVLGVSLGGSLALRMSLDMTKDSRPPAGVKSIDIDYSTALDYSF